VRTRPAKAEEANRTRPATARHRRIAGRESTPAEPTAKADLTIFLKVAAISCLFCTGIIHGLWTAMHFHEWLGAGVFFFAVATLQTLGGFAVAVVPGRLAYLANFAINAGTVLVWAVSRTTGMPVGPEAGQRATVGMPDLVATLLELMIILALLPLLLGRPAVGRQSGWIGRMPRRAYLALAGIPVYTLVLTCVAVVPAAAGHGGH
jgi:hypothetical protein